MEDDDYPFPTVAIKELPHELLIVILTFLPGDEVMRCERVCKEWQQMIHHIDQSRERLLELRGHKRRKGKEIEKDRSEGSRQFWITLCDSHFPEAMMMRRFEFDLIFLIFQQKVSKCHTTCHSEYLPNFSLIRQQFYVHHEKVELLRRIYSLEKSIMVTNSWKPFMTFQSLEQALESESSLFSDVCIFSVDLMELYVKLHKIDVRNDDPVYYLLISFSSLQRFYNGQRLEETDFEKHKLDFVSDFYPLLREYRCSLDSNQLIRFVALIKLNEANVSKKLQMKLMMAQVSET